MIVMEHTIKPQAPPLCMFLGGPAGSGKSCVINALNAYFMQAGQDNWFLLTSYMGVTA